MKGALGSPLFCEYYKPENNTTFVLVGLVTCSEKTKPTKMNQKFPLEKSGKET
jgi:hypothetical protein